MRILFLVLSFISLAACADKLKGPAGSEGPAGTPGEPGVSGEPCSVTDTEGGGLMACPDGSSLVLQDGADGVNGASGQRGPEGPRGPAGGRGPQGPSGGDGTIGPMGPQGPRGDQGPMGPAGPEGPEGPGLQMDMVYTCFSQFRYSGIYISNIWFRVYRYRAGLYLYTMIEQIMNAGAIAWEYHDSFMWPSQPDVAPLVRGWNFTVSYDEVDSIATFHYNDGGTPWQAQCSAGYEDDLDS